MRRNILFIDLGSHFGGVEKYIQGLVELLNGHASLFAICSLPDLADNLRKSGVKVVCIPILYNKWCKALRFLIGLVILPYFLLRYQIHCVQVNGFFESMLLLPIKAFRRRAVYTMHGPFETELYTWYKNPERYFPRAFSRWCLRFATAIVCVSEEVGRAARRNLDARVVVVIPNWVSSVPERQRNATSIHIPVRVLVVGRLEEYKGVHLLIEAVKGLSNVAVTVVGDGAFRSSLEKQASGYDVKFTGFKKELSEFYSNSDIFVNPSLGPEGSSLVTLDAMSNGIPCLTSDIPVFKEIAQEGTSAMLFRSGDAIDLRMRLEILIDDGRIRESLIRHAYSLIETTFSRAAAGDSYRSVLVRSDREGADDA